MNTWFEVDGLSAHLLDLAHLDILAIEIRIEQRETLGRLLHVLEVGGSCQQQHLVRDLRRRDPDLLAVDAVAIAFARRLRLEPGRVEADVRLRHREAGLLFALDERRQEPALLLLGAEHHDRIEAEDVHVHRRGALHAGARFGNRLHHDGRLGDAEPGAAKFLGHGDTEPAIHRQRLMEVVREPAFLVLLQPIIVPEAGADFLDRGANCELLGAELIVHV